MFTQKVPRSSFAEQWQECWDVAEDFSLKLESVNRARVVGVLDRAGSGGGIGIHELPVLLSPAAESELERMASLAHGRSLRQFGRTIQLFTPIYISNHCINRCLYCGFSAKHHIARHKLNLTEIEAEARAIAATGLRQILLLTGDSPKFSPVEYIAESIGVLSRYFPSIGVEIYALTEDEYRRIGAAGCDSLTMYQETYNSGLYSKLHPAGPKRDFFFRLGAPERAARAGFRAVNLGPLLGLDLWQRDVFMLAMHAEWMRRSFPHLELGLSLPRMRPCEGAEQAALQDGFTPLEVSDRHFVQALLALRLFLPEAGISVSTRESPQLRENLIPLGITRLSAGVSTAVGGHAVTPEDNIPQFEISDSRSVSEITGMILQQGYQPVFKDWEPLSASPANNGWKSFHNEL